MMVSRLILLLPTWWLLGCQAALDTMYSSSAAQPKAQSSTGKSRRERNLDHWDGDTLAFYLDNYMGHDVAVMFYAQWDRNSHSLAPLWDRIATEFDAGSSESRLIMALFDCELNQQHIELCKALAITHYPTLMFVGAGPYHDTDPVTGAILGSKSAGQMGISPVWNTVRFQGNWQYGDAIMDWIRTMQALSNWHTWSTEGFGKKLRSFFLPQKKGKKTSLPVGVPGGNSLPASALTATGSSSSASASSTSGDSAINTAKVQSLEVEMESLKKTNDLYEAAVMRSSVQIDSLLFPTHTDVFQFLYTNKAWDTEVSDSNDILRTCALEVSLDYCGRVGTNVATEVVDALEAKGTLESITMEVLEKEVRDMINKKEPFCEVLENCLATGLQGDECRPKQCPFQSEAACRYVASCLDPSIQNEYSEAMGLGGASTSTTAGGATGTSGAFGL
jgi:hypothetical protein